MLTIWKHPIEPLRPVFEVEWPMGSQIVHVGLVEGHPAMWFRTDPERLPKVRRRFELVVTGEPMTDHGAESWHHRGTFVLPTHGTDIVLHLMETNE